MKRILEPYSLQEDVFLMLKVTYGSRRHSAQVGVVTMSRSEVKSVKEIN